MAEMAARVPPKAATAAESGDMPANAIGAEDDMQDGATHMGGGAHTWPTNSNFTSRRKRDKKHIPGELCNEDSQESLEEYEYRQRTTPISSTLLDVDNDDFGNNTASASLHLGGDQRLGSSSTRLDDTSRTLPLTSSSAVRKGKRKTFSTMSNREGKALREDMEDEIQDDDDMPSKRPAPEPTRGLGRQRGSPMSEHSSPTGPPQPPLPPHMVVASDVMGRAADDREIPTSDVRHSQSSASGSSSPGGHSHPQHLITHADRVLLYMNKHQRLLLLLHASKCPNEDGQCSVTPDCASMKQLWRHISVCRDQQCQVQYCMSSKYWVTHYRRCRDMKCPVCAPVREVIRKSQEGEGEEEQQRKGREIMRMAAETPNFEPVQIPLEYIKESTDDFLDERELGEGSFSRVFVGKDRVLKCKFAVKQMKLRFHSEMSLAEARRTFEKEIETLKHFRHRNIARLYGYHLDPDLLGTHCLVYELASLGSLEQILSNESQKGRLDWTKRISIALDVARALEYMHNGKGGQICYHRDLKPANICLKRDYTAVLIDWGVAKMIPLDDSKATMTVMESAGNGLRGTPGYICPDCCEHIAQGISYSYSSASDIFSFGVVMTEIFTGALQNSLRDGKETNLYNRYIRDGKNVNRDVDKSAGDWARPAKTNFPKLALECMSREPEKRPSITMIAERLGTLDSKARPRSPGEQNSITVLVSSPLVYVEDGGKKPMMDSLHFGRERDLLQACIKESKRDIQLAFDTATIDRLQSAATKRCGCLHFSGHGFEDRLVFEDDRGGVRWLTEKDIKDCVHREPFTLVFISACHSEYMGNAFVDAGVKHVVCCNYDEKIEDEAAIKFTHQFYMALAEGYTIQNAFEKGKNAARKYCVKEASNFLLLPFGGNHDVQVFHAEELEWDEGTSPATLIPPVPEHFLGREVDMYHVLQLVLDHRLVNLVGGHGIGCSSLASAVSHYVSDRKSTFLSIESIYFLRGHDQYSAMLKQLHGQLENEGQTKCLPSDDDSLLADSLVNALSGVKALVVLDDVATMEESVISFAARLLEASDSMRLLISTSEEVNITSPHAERQVYKLGPLDVAPTVTLFGKACRHIPGNAEYDILLERVASSESLFKKMGEGIPACTLKAAKHFQKEEYENLFQAQSHTLD